MKILFSKRHEEAIRKKVLPLYFPDKLRTSIERILSEYSDYGTLVDDDGWEERNANLNYHAATEYLKTFYGLKELQAFGKDDKRGPASFKEVILNGYPSEVLDCIECWFNNSPSKIDQCEKELNDILYIHNSPWRFINCSAVLIDSEYLHQEVRTRTMTLLKESKAYGALEEFQGAINDLTSSDTKDAIIKAHKSVESTMKAVLGSEYQEYRFGQLLNRLITSGKIPEYYEDFFKNFEQLALGAVKERNLPGRGHGQGAISTEVDKSLAEFAVNLAGSINLFILRHPVAKKFEEDSDIPF